MSYALVRKEEDTEETYRKGCHVVMEAEMEVTCQAKDLSFELLLSFRIVVNLVSVSMSASFWVVYHDSRKLVYQPD